MRKLSLIVMFCHLLSLSACLEDGGRTAEGDGEMLNGHVREPGKWAEEWGLRRTVAVLTDYPVLFPLDGRRTRYRVSSGFGYRIHPLKGRRIFHKGVDLAAPYGEPVYSAGNGRVISAGYSPGYGRTVLIRHGGGYSTLYAHMSRILVRKGETVRIGQRIGKVGSTGMSTGNHLHFELQKNGRLLDPVEWFGRRF